MKVSISFRISWWVRFLSSSDAFSSKSRSANLFPDVQIEKWRIVFNSVMLNIFPCCVYIRIPVPVSVSVLTFVFIWPRCSLLLLITFNNKKEAIKIMNYRTPHYWTTYTSSVKSCRIFRSLLCSRPIAESANIFEFFNHGRWNCSKRMCPILREKNNKLFCN